MMQFKQLKKQKGITLMEVIAGLLIMGLVVSGALSLFSSADSSQKSNQMAADLMAIRSAVKGLYAQQGGYGTANINATLKNAKRIPTTMSVDSSTPPVITHSMNGSVTVTGATSTFTVSLTNVPTDVCVQMLTNSSTGWSSVKVGSATAITTFPVDPTVASSSTNCAASDSNTLLFTGA